MSSRPLLTDEEITRRYMDEWYSYRAGGTDGTKRSNSEIEEKRKELLSAATAQIDRQRKQQLCVVL